MTALSAQLALTGALPGAALADFYLHSWQNEHATARQLRFDIQAGYYASPNNFDGAGALLVPSSFQQYTRFQTDALAAYGINSKLSAFARLNWARTELDQTSLISTQYGFGDSSAGLNYRVLDLSTPEMPDGVTIDVQVQGDLPLYSNENLTGPAMGDGTIDVTGGAFASVPLLRPGRYLLGLSGGAGLTYRTDDYSRALPWSVSTKIGPASDSGFTAKAMASGMVSLSSDPRSQGLAVGSTALSADSGGSFIAGAVNPSILTLRLEAGYQISTDMGLTGFAAQSVWGQAAPNGFFGGLALRMRTGGTRPAGDPTLMSPLEYGRANQGFVNYALEAKVTRVNDRLNLVKLDKGTQDGIEAGQTFDIFKLKKDGTPGEPIARGKVTSIKLNEAVMTIDEYFKEVWIDEGFVAKRPIQ